MGILRTPGEVAAQLPSVPLFMGVWVMVSLVAAINAIAVALVALSWPAYALAARAPKG